MYTDQENSFYCTKSTESYMQNSLTALVKKYKQHSKHVSQRSGHKMKVTLWYWSPTEADVGSLLTQAVISTKKEMTQANMRVLEDTQVNSRCN